MWQHVRCVACLIEVLIERGRLDEAQTVLEASGGEDATASDARADLFLSARSTLRVAQGDLRGALADQLESRGSERRH